MTFVWNENDVEWWKAPLPRWWHRCKPQTTGVISESLVERCACGAIRLDGSGFWGERNSRRKMKGDK
jgi:hypothetical protein